MQFEADQAEKRAKSMDRQLAALENRFDPLNKATLRYERGLRTLDRAFEAGKVDAERYQRTLDSLKREFDEAKVKAAAAGTFASLMRPKSRQRLPGPRFPP